FGRAARRLNMAQPPLSQSIQRLEAELGVTLIDRSHRAVQLTPPGQVFLNEARRTLQQAELARVATRRAASTMPEVHISIIGPALYQFLPPFLAGYHAEETGISVRLHEQSSADQIKGMLAGKFDLGFVSAGTGWPDEFDHVIVERSQVVALVPASSQLAGKAKVKLAELAEQPFILPPQRHSAHILDMLSVFKNEGNVPNVVQESLQTNTTMTLVSAGLGCSLVCNSAITVAPPNLCFIPLDLASGTLEFQLAMVWLRNCPNDHAVRLIARAKAFLAKNPQFLDPEALLPAP
ncbi:MAG TPA: LysR family transcriptional regulator, partial [Novosphingobium sp.]|nr:LysR family transcriptional regulator [Novosphingobium sp.]